jgi:transposase
MAIYIGLDVHSKQTVYVAQDQEGQLLGQGSVPTCGEGLRQVVRMLQAPAQTPIGLETGTQATWVSRQLTALGMKPVVIDAREVRVKARRIGQKSDRRDAFEICDGLRRAIYTSIVYVPEEPIEKLRMILSRRRHFVRLCTRQTSAAKFLLRSRGLRELARTMTTELAWDKLLARTVGTPIEEYLAMHAQLWKQAQATVKQLDHELHESAKPFRATMGLLQTLPGIGPVTAATFIATLGTPERFADSSRVVSYVGLAVSTYDSGERQCHGHITKSGSPELRAMLCEAAHQAARPQHPLNPYFARLCAKRGLKQAVVAVAQRLARILFQIWRKGEPFDLNKLNVKAVRKIKTRMVHYELKHTTLSVAA